MCPRTYGLRLSLNRFVSLSPSPEDVEVADAFCASIMSIVVWSWRTLARVELREAGAIWGGIRRAVAVAVEAMIRAAEHGPLRLNRTGGMQRRGYSRGCTAAHSHGEMRRICSR